MNTPPWDETDLGAIQDKLAELRREICRCVLGQDGTVEEILMALAAGGHALLEGVPGLGKTLLVKTMADAVGLSFHRIQFTPDLMPSDIVGTEILEEDHGTGKRIFKFNKGPVFSQLLLADEINRTPPKTQAALLEAMQENSVTYAGVTYPLQQPFFVLATQNPLEQAGTYPLPEAQLDRFLLYIRMRYPAQDDERSILAATTGCTLPHARKVMEAADIITMRQMVRQVHISAGMLDYATALMRGSRPETSPLAFVRNWVRWGAGTRAGQALILGAKARAFLDGRYSVEPDDLRHLVPPIFRHRVLVNFKAESEGIDADRVCRELLSAIPQVGSGA